MRCVIDKLLKIEPKKKGQYNRKQVGYLQTLSRAPQAASWWRSGPRCRLCGRHTPWPAGTPLWTWSLWNWTQSDTDIEVTLIQQRNESDAQNLTGFLHISLLITDSSTSSCLMGFQTDLFWDFVPARNRSTTMKIQSLSSHQCRWIVGNFPCPQTLFTPSSFRQLVS